MVIQPFTDQWINSGWNATSAAIQRPPAGPNTARPNRKATTIRREPASRPGTLAARSLAPKMANEIAVAYELVSPRKYRRPEGTTGNPVLRTPRAASDNLDASSPS